MPEEETPNAGAQQPNTQDEGAPQQSVQDGEKDGEKGQVETPTQPFDWNDERNPWRYTAMQQQQNIEQLQTMIAGAQVNDAKVQLKQAGYSDEQIAGIVEVAQERQKLEQDRARLAEQARPAVALELSKRIEKEYQVKIDPQELLTTSTGQAVRTPEAMLARADALISERRRTVRQERKESGADKVDEAGGGTHTLDEARLSKMSPTAILKMGLSKVK